MKTINGAPQFEHHSLTQKILFDESTTDQINTLLSQWAAKRSCVNCKNYRKHDPEAYAADRIDLCKKIPYIYNSVKPETFSCAEFGESNREGQEG